MTLQQIKDFTVKAATLGYTAGKATAKVGIAASIATSKAGIAGTKKAFNIYNTNRFVQVGINTPLFYSVLKGVAHATHHDDLALLVDMSAPSLSGLYLNAHIQSGDKTAIKDWATFFIMGAVGADMGMSVAEVDSNGLAGIISDAYHRVHDLVDRNIQGDVPEFVPGGVIGAAFASGKMIYDYYVEEKNKNN